MRSILLAAVLSFATLLIAQEDALAYSEVCEASWYGPGLVGNLTASGSVYTGEAGTAAHPWLPLGTVVQVDSWYGTAYLTITDRGPYAYGRCLDVSWGSSWIVGYGVAPVTLTVV
jgi:rare lipoprotein A